MPRKKRVDSSADADPPSSAASEEDVVTDSLGAIKLAFQRLRDEKKQLRKEKQTLETDVQVLRASSNTSSSSRTKTTSTARIKNLEKELKESKNEASKYKSRFEKLRAAELQREQRELEGGFEDGAGTLEDRFIEMKKLLRSFRSLVEEVVLEDPGEEGGYPDCAICYEELSKDTAAAFPCEHIFHMACIRELDRHAKQQELETLRNLACPTCRKNWDFSAVLRVSRTASEQWQDLIEVATEWAKMDINKDEIDIETSDKTSEPSFIENDMDSGESAEEEQTNQEVEDEEDGHVDGEARALRSSEGELTAPHRTPPRSQKRRRLEELAAARSAKKQKR